MRDLRLQCGLIATVLAIVFCQAGLCQSTEIHCPSTLTVQESPLLNDLPGWIAHDNSVKGLHHFYGIGFSEGPPEELVWQAPASSTKTNKSRVDTYDLTAISQDVWISCLYRDTSQSLTQKLPKKFSR